MRKFLLRKTLFWYFAGFVTTNGYILGTQQQTLEEILRLLSEAPFTISKSGVSKSTPIYQIDSRLKTYNETLQEALSRLASQDDFDFILKNFPDVYQHALNAWQFSLNDASNQFSIAQNQEGEYFEGVRSTTINTTHKLKSLGKLSAYSKNFFIPLSVLLSFKKLNLDEYCRTIETEEQRSKLALQALVDYFYTMAYLRIKLAHFVSLGSTSTARGLRNELCSFNIFYRSIKNRILFPTCIDFVDKHLKSDKAGRYTDLQRVKEISTRLNTQHLNYLEKSVFDQNSEDWKNFSKEIDVFLKNCTLESAVSISQAGTPKIVGKRDSDQLQDEEYEKLKRFVDRLENTLINIQKDIAKEIEIHYEKLTKTNTYKFGLMNLADVSDLNANQEEFFFTQLLPIFTSDQFFAPINQIRFELLKILDYVEEKPFRLFGKEEDTTLDSLLKKLQSDMKFKNLGKADLEKIKNHLVKCKNLIYQNYQNCIIQENPGSSVWAFLLTDPELSPIFFQTIPDKINESLKMIENIELKSGKELANALKKLPEDIFSFATIQDSFFDHVLSKANECKGKFNEKYKFFDDYFFEGLNKNNDDFEKSMISKTLISLMTFRQHMNIFRINLLKEFIKSNNFQILREEISRLNSTLYEYFGERSTDKNFDGLTTFENEVFKKYVDGQIAEPVFQLCNPLSQNMVISCFPMIVYQVYTSYKKILDKMLLLATQNNKVDWSDVPKVLSDLEKRLDALISQVMILKATQSGYLTQLELQPVASLGFLTNQGETEEESEEETEEESEEESEEETEASSEEDSN